LSTDSATFEQEHVLLPVKSYSPSSASTGAWPSAVPRDLRNDVLTGSM